MMTDDEAIVKSDILSGEPHTSYQARRLLVTMEVFRGFGMPSPASAAVLIWAENKRDLMRNTPVSIGSVLIDLARFGLITNEIRMNDAGDFIVRRMMQ